MFYAQFVLAKKGSLSKLWLAAHWERKLSKAQIFETDVSDAVDEILRPKVGCLHFLGCCSAFRCTLTFSRPCYDHVDVLLSLVVTLLTFF